MNPRSDVVGSLLRPAYLVEAREAREAGRLAPVELKRIEDRAVDEAVALQQGRASTSSPTANSGATPSSAT